MTIQYFLSNILTSSFCSRYFISDIFFVWTINELISVEHLGWKHPARVPLGQFGMNKEQIKVFKELKEHFWREEVLYQTIKTKERLCHSCKYIVFIMRRVLRVASKS